MVRVKMSDVNEHLTDDEIIEIKAAEKRPIVYDEDSPQMTKKMLDQFHGFDFVTIRVSREIVNKAKSIDKDYQSFLSRIIEAAFNDNNLIRKCM
ncbi:MAG: hypothetical protein K5795_00635 [Lachnospiraceae bacterium]|nr:hypothetical protein [Lachnospiraceae bacterium]